MLPDGYTDLPAGKLAAIVTSLEMLAPPSLRPDPPAAPWTLAHLPRPDLDRYRRLYRHVGQGWLWFSRLQKSDAELAAIVHDPAVEVHALRAGDSDEGLLELDFRRPGICELLYFGVGPGLVGSGAGRWLMNRALGLVWSRPVQRFWVHTCTLDDPRALPFYQRSGFRPFLRQVEVADDPRHAGVLPPDAAPHIPLL